MAAAELPLLWFLEVQLSVKYRRGGGGGGGVCQPVPTCCKHFGLGYHLWLQRSVRSRAHRSGASAPSVVYVQVHYGRGGGRALSKCASRSGL